MSADWQIGDLALCVEAAPLTPRRIEIQCPNCSGSGEDPLYYRECQECLGYGSWEEVVDPVTIALLDLEPKELPDGSFQVAA